MKSLEKWAKRRLKYVATINNEALPETTDPDFEINYIDIGNVSSLGTINKVERYRFGQAPSRARRIVQNGDVIISTVRTYLQAIAPIINPPENLIVSTGFAVVHPNEKILDTGFCKYALRTPQFLWEVESRSVGVSYPAINSSELEDIQIELPPLQLQRYIATYLDKETARIDALIDEKEQMLKLLEEKRTSLISHVVTRGLDPSVLTKPSGLEWIGDIPIHWEVKRGKFLFNQSHLPVQEGDEIVTCFRDGQVTLRKNRRVEGFTNAIKEVGYQGIKPGQLVLHSMDAFAGAIGVSDSEGKCSPEYIICDPKIEQIFNLYYGQLLRVMALRGFILAACTAVRERAPRIRFSHLANLFLPVPPLKEQKAIISAIKQEREHTAEMESDLKQSIDLLKERRSALITAAVTGQLDLEAIHA